MNSEVKKVVRWSFIGGFVALAIDWAVSGSQPMGIRVAVGIMCFGAGFVTGGLLAANFGEEKGESHSH
ncbi:MAG: hypothetical protein FJ293_01885 [Planctomycetes bacterium]|nr:hypothetical protein [Planctomycetota bacterium]